MHYMARYAARDKTINGRRTSFRLEPVFWEGLDEIALIEKTTPEEVIAFIKKNKKSVELKRQ